MAITIYHNPRCSKSREALSILNDHRAAPQVVNYLETPPTVEELRRLLQMLGLAARGLIRTGEAEYKDLGLDDPALDEETLIKAMVEHPRLIQRPIVVHGNRAILGRPPEKVLELL